MRKGRGQIEKLWSDPQRKGEYINGAGVQLIKIRRAGG